MKKLLLIALTSALCLSSCSDDDSSGEVPPENPSTDINALIGKWKYTSGTTNGIDIPLTTCGNSEIVQFSDDNIYTTEDLIQEGNECTLNQIITANYEVLGNQITLTNSNIDVFNNSIFEFNIDGNTLSLSSTVSGFEIISFFTKTTDPLFSETETIDSPESSALIGKWRLDFFTPFTEDGITHSIQECEKESIYEYTEDGIYAYEYVLNIEDGNGTCGVDDEGISNYTVNGNKLIIEDDRETTTTTFSISEGVLTLIYENGEIDKYIKTTDPFFSEL